MKTCPFYHDHPDNDPSFDDCQVAYEDAKARLAPKPEAPRRPMLVVGHRYRVVYREAGKRIPRDMIADFVSNTESFSYWSGRPEFGTVNLAFKDVIEFTEVSRQTNPVRKPAPVRAT